MTAPIGNTLITDFDLMRAVAAATDTCNDELQALLSTFIGRMRSVPPSVWAGSAAARFQDVVDRWNTESVRLHRALADIAVTIRHNEQTLRQAADRHARHITAVAEHLGGVRR